MKSLIGRSAECGVRNVVIGMPHRGRLNVLNNVVRKRTAQIFAEFADSQEDDPDSGHGDVKYHLGMSLDTKGGKDKTAIHLTLMANPSHLEAVNPVALGKTKAKQFYANDEGGSASMAMLLHGDAAFAGQGVVYESMGFMDLQHYSTGGTVHMVINNQVGSDHTPCPPSVLLVACFSLQLALLTAVPRCFLCQLYDGSLSGEEYAVLHGPGEGVQPAGVPRQRRRPRGGGARVRAGGRVEGALQDRRRHRPGVLPQVRPQRDRRAVVHAAAHVRQDRQDAVRSGQTSHGAHRHCREWRRWGQGGDHREVEMARRSSVWRGGATCPSVACALVGAGAPPLSDGRGESKQKMWRARTHTSGTAI